MRKQRHGGFTLVEMIISIVLLGIVAGMLAPVIKNSIDAYSDTQSRSHLLDKVRVSLGRLSRELRQGTVPTIDADGSTLEFVTTTVGGRYVSFNSQLPRIHNDHCSRQRNPPGSLERFLPGEPIGTLCVLYPGDLDSLAAARRDALIIGRDVVPVDPVDGITAQVSGTPDEYQGALWKVKFTNEHTFSTASASEKEIYSLADYRHRVSISGGNLVWERTGASAPAGDFSSADEGILIDNVTSFITDLDSENGVVSLSLTVSEGTESITVSEDVYVRN